MQNPKGLKGVGKIEGKRGALLADGMETRANKLPEEQRGKEHPPRTVFTGRDRKTEEVVVVASDARGPTCFGRNALICIALRPTCPLNFSTFLVGAEATATTRNAKW